MAIAFGKRFGFQKFCPNLTRQCDPQVERVVAQTLAEKGEDAVIVDLGAGGRRVAPKAITVDFLQTGDTDLVCDVCDVPMEEGTVDLVIATGLLEHVEDDAPVLNEARRLLKPNGVLHVETPFMQQYHDDPIDVRRYTVTGQAMRLKHHGFAIEDSGFHIGPGVAIATLNAYYASILFDGKSIIRKVMSRGAFWLVSCLFWPLTLLDRFVKNREQAHRLAFGVYTTARKAPAAA